MQMTTQTINRPELLVWTPEMVKNFWDYESQFPEAYFSYHYAYPVAKMAAKYLPKGASLVDYGCGPGFLIEALLAGNYRAAGMDFSPDTVERAQAKFAGQPNFLSIFRFDDIEKHTGKFDGVFVLEVIEHLYDDALEDLLNAAKSLVKPGGLIIMTTPNEEKLEENYIICPVTNKLFHRWQHVRAWSQDTLCEHLTNKGFEIVDAFQTSFSASLAAKGKGSVLRQKIRGLRKTLKYAMSSRKKRPHLCVVARVAE